MKQTTTPKKSKLTIVSRKSALAMWQAEFVKTKLLQLYPTLEINILGVNTTGDKILNVSLAKIGGKGLFVKELEEQLLNHQADIAVHSMKDVPAELPPGLIIPVIPEREDPRDALIFNSRFLNTLNFTKKELNNRNLIPIDHYLEKLPAKTIVGTSSLRRQAQLYALRNDLTLETLRGNVDTRLKKLDAGEYDAIILAVAGLKRLGFADRIQALFEPEQMLPGVGQGALGIQCRSDDIYTQSLIAPLHHSLSGICVAAERSMNALLGGSCQLPVAGLAEITTKDTHSLKLTGMVGKPNGEKILRTEIVDSIEKSEDAVDIGKRVAQQLLELGAGEIIDSI